MAALGVLSAHAAERVPVASSVISAVTYHAEERLLDVEFRSGAAYRYLAVPPAIHKALMHASSKGRYFNAEIRERYRSQRLKRAPLASPPP